jgi:hypothetical protein
MTANLQQIWRFSSQKYRIHTVYTWFWPTLGVSCKPTRSDRSEHWKTQLHVCALDIFSLAILVYILFVRTPVNLDQHAQNMHPSHCRLSQERVEDWDYQFSASVLEIYNERIFDLLAGGRDQDGDKLDVKQVRVCVSTCVCLLCVCMCVCVPTCVCVCCVCLHLCVCCVRVSTCLCLIRGTHTLVFRTDTIFWFKQVQAIEFSDLCDHARATDLIHTR